MLLLAAIAIDVMGDADCDPLPENVRSEAVARGPGGDGADDPCSDVCLPDCFCCCRSVAAGTAMVPPAPVPLSPLAAVDPDEWSEGVHGVVDRPPRA